MFLQIFSNSCLVNLLLVRSHQAEIIVVKRLNQGRNKVTRVQVEPRSCDRGRRKNDGLLGYAAKMNALVVSNKLLLFTIALASIFFVTKNTRMSILDNNLIMMSIIFAGQSFSV